MEIALSVNARNQVTITTSLRQSMQILQLSLIELQQYLQECSTDNPLIEIFPGRSVANGGGKLSGRSRHGTGDWWLNLNQPCAPSLETVLTEQLNLLGLTPDELRMCSFIIGCLDDNGYLTQTADWIANFKNVALPDVQRALRSIQSLEPAGLAASCLEECLLLQLSPADQETGLMRSLIRFELAQIAQGKIKALANKYAVEPAAIQEAVDRITSLNPKPGAPYGPNKPQYIVPDLFLRSHNGSSEITMEDDHLPAVSLNPDYSRLLLENNQPREVMRFLRQKRQEAKWIIQSLDYRKATLLKIAGSIFGKQADFCAHGPSRMQPLSMRVIAEELNMHDSTISRAVNDKYIMTPWGLFELKHFFTASLKQLDGETVSALTAKERVKEIVKAEDKSDPLSDIKISERLRQEGILISRRTVTKYRNQLNILCIAQRKRYEA